MDPENPAKPPLPDRRCSVKALFRANYVIAGMESASGRVVGYEANGGFLLGFTARAPAGTLLPLMTRDSMLPLIAPLAKAAAKGVSLASLVAAEPP